jgi:hypothetical protein
VLLLVFLCERNEAELFARKKESRGGFLDSLLEFRDWFDVLVPREIAP